MKLHPYIKNGYYISIFTNSENSKTSKPNVLTLKLTEKLDLRLGERLLLYQILEFITHGRT